MENNIGHGVLIAPLKISDYVLGGNTKIESSVNVSDWSPFLPEFENQFNEKGDLLICATMSAQHELETQLNYMLKNSLMWDEAVNFFKQNKYIVNGKFNLSARFNAKINGTDKTKGNYLNVVADSFHNNGFVPEYLWPMTENMSWAEYYKDVPQSLKDLAKKALWFLNIQYQWINKVDFSVGLKIAPIQIATAICPGWGEMVVKKCSGKAIQHATVLYAENPNLWLILDQYPPYKGSLAQDYELPYNMQYVVSMKPITLRRGMQGVNVLTFQEDLKKLGYKLDNDSFFGPGTEAIVKSFQSKNGLVADGIAGTATLSKIKELFTAPKPNYIDLWCGGIKKMEGSKPYRNNPGNIRYTDFFAQYAVNDNGFCKFDTYEHGYQALKMLITNACLGKSKFYNSNGNLYDFFAVYAPSSDNNNPKHYAEFVATEMRVDPLTIIKTLL